MGGMNMGGLDTGRWNMGSLSLARRMALLGLALLLLLLAGSLAIHTWAARNALESQLALRNADGAAALAVVLSQRGGDLPAMQALAQAHLRQGVYRSVQLWLPDGQAAINLVSRTQPQRAPAWFVSFMALQPMPGVAPVLDGPHPLATLRLESRQAWAYDALWDACLLTLQLLLALAVLAALLATLALRSWQRPLAATLAQAQALEQGRFIEAEEPSLPELRAVTRSMNAMVRRLRDVFAAQADQVQVLQRQAQVDAVTGLPLRRHFVGRLQADLAGPDGPGVGLILVRVLELDQLNQRLGHEATDRLLGTAAGLLLAYVDRVPGTFAGRLNGSDLALGLPVAGVALETAQSLQAALRAAPALHAGGAQIVVGGVDGLSDIAVGPALAAADAALAQAEAEGGFAVQASGSSVADPAGSRAWREQLAAALAEGRVRLGEFALRDRQGTLIHLECPLRVQLQPDGEFHEAGRWLALARRSRLLPQVDLAALDLARAAVVRDGQPRGVNVALPSLSSPGFIDDVARRLMDSPLAAQRLSLEWADPTSAADQQAVRAAVAAWRAHGVRLGVEHAGAQPQQLALLCEMGLDYIKIDNRHLRGAATDPAVRAYAQSLVKLIHGLGLTALAEGIDGADDLQALWDLGFDGATGPAVADGEPAPSPAAALVS